MQQRDTGSAHHGRANVSRRSFLKASGLTAISVGAADFLVACGPSAETVEIGEEESGSQQRTFGDNGTMRVGMEVAYPPFNWQVSEETEDTIPVEGQSDAYADGYDIYFAKKIAEHFNLNPVASKMEFSGLVEALKNGQIDIICGGMTATDERRESIDFSDPYWTSHYGLLVRKGSAYVNATSLDDFAGAAVLGQRDTLLDTVINEIPNVNHLTPVDSVPAQLSNLNQGACDAITFDVENERGLLKANPDLTPVEINGSQALFQEDAPINAGIAKGQGDTLQQINDVVNSVPQDERQQVWNDVQARLPE